MRWLLLFAMMGCSFRAPSSGDDVMVDAADDPDAAGDGAPPADARSPARSCSEITGATGIHQIDPDGEGPATPFEVHCEQDLHGGRWTLAASFVNGDGLRSWDTKGELTSVSVVGTLAERQTADFKSPAYATVPGKDLLIVTDEYSFGFNAVIDDQAVNQWVNANAPAACAGAWRVQGADYAAGLSQQQLETLGIIFRGRDPNEPTKCFPGGEEVSLIAFVAGNLSNHGLGNAPVASDWGDEDLGLPNLAHWNVVSCTGSYPCKATGVRTQWPGDVGYTAESKAKYALLFVR